MQHWVDRKCLGAFCVTCTWSDTHGRGFRDRLSQSLSETVRNTRTVTRRARVERHTLRRLEDLPSLGSATTKMEKRAFRLFGSVLERQNDLQPAKTYNQRKIPAGKKRPNFVEAGKVKRQPAKCRQCRLCGEPCIMGHRTTPSCTG